MALQKGKLHSNISSGMQKSLKIFKQIKSRKKILKNETS